MDLLRILFKFGLFLSFIALNKVNGAILGVMMIRSVSIYLPDRAAVRGNPNKSEILLPDPFSITRSKYHDARRKNKVIIHGYNETINDYDIVRLKDEYLKHEDYNVWMIDWSYYTADCKDNYHIVKVVSQMDHIGNCTSELIHAIRRSYFVRNTFHIIGIGVGSHVAGYVSKYLQRPNKLARITALDPALTSIDGSRARPVHKGDADFVDVLHTNAGFAGYLSPLGDIDFYLNGGIFQPGCPINKELFGCNHHRALKYFIESISSDTGFYGSYCTDYIQYLKNECPSNESEALMGEHASKKKLVGLARYGIYIVPTKAKPPYAEGEGPHIAEDPHTWTFIEFVRKFIGFVRRSSYVPVRLRENIRFDVPDLIRYLSEADEEDEFNTLDFRLKCYRRIQGFKFYNDEWTPALEHVFGFKC